MIKIPACHLDFFFFTFSKSSDLSYILIDPVVNMVAYSSCKSKARDTCS